jgi:hypothetical protein
MVSVMLRQVLTIGIERVWAHVSLAIFLVQSTGHTRQGVQGFRMTGQKVEPLSDVRRAGQRLTVIAFDNTKKRETVDAFRDFPRCCS